MLILSYSLDRVQALKDITGNNAQIALSSFMFGALISVLGTGAACIVIMDRLDITMGQLVDVTTGQQSRISVSIESSLQRSQQMQQLA